ncbi:MULTISPECIES: GntR family transcriptional regulator [unclassified Pseudomonas]|jgi:DNA-binding GntR family transcriptional regulator|uniref:GntR family transcriptional regulator n=1 Tax=unclassified Pseudomonas TaxID=196821 RepID=UPI0007300E80|nr:MULTISPECIES: GntR family transcriptional regulator [unclassified Pseudomonas]KSW24822.1 GntR family transcriptional regulator [Pseudomonas sp. ADP]OBP08478.1 GntR family transcriptional regulator [Pseudomonas sp. EGD-AKN5]QOF87382.1 GntR family transcriptional regulator [Pseudomonas sp. ADPe]
MAENLQQQLYQNLRQALLSGRFQPGERLKIRDLADEWGTSPMPVRAALQRLVAEGALEGEPQRSLRVPLMTRERFLQILQIRQSLEGLAVEDGVPRLQEADIEVLQACTEAMEEAVRRRDVQAYLEHNSRFHLTLYRACGNPTLLRMIEALWLQVGPFFNRLFTGADLSLRLNDFHGQALDAIRRGDARGARAAIEQDLAYFGQYLLNLLALESGASVTR